jgi:IS30 family transposase
VTSPDAYSKNTESVINALIENARLLPQELYRSLTWDRGKDMAAHKETKQKQG